MNDIDRYAATNIMAQSRIEELERRLAHAQACLAEVDAQLNIVGASPSDYATHLELLKEGRDSAERELSKIDGSGPSTSVPRRLFENAKREHEDDMRRASELLVQTQNERDEALRKEKEVRTQAILDAADLYGQISQAQRERDHWKDYAGFTTKWAAESSKTAESAGELLEKTRQELCALAFDYGRLEAERDHWHKQCQRVTATLREVEAGRADR